MKDGMRYAIYAIRKCMRPVVLIMGAVLATSFAGASPASELLQDLKASMTGGRFDFSWTHVWMTPWPVDGDARFAENDAFFENGVAAATCAAPRFYYSDLAGIVGTWHSDDYYKTNRKSFASVIKKAWKEYRGVCVFSWHMDHPCCTNRFPQCSYRYKCKEHRNVVKAILEDEKWPCGTGQIKGMERNAGYDSPRAWFFRQLKDAAAFFKTLVDEDGNRIPVIVRFPHEMDGNWFWWGRGWCSPSEFIALCRLEADTLRELCGTEQLLFAYDPDRLWKDLGAPDDGGCNFLTWYPGDAYVDIVGCDDYSIGTGRSDKEARANEEASVRRFRIISKFAVEHGKAAALTETGINKGTRDDFYESLLRIVTAPDVDVAFVNTWGDAYTMPPDRPVIVEGLKRFLSCPKVMTKRYFIDVPGALRMHAPKAMFFRVSGGLRRFRAIVGFDPAIDTLKRKYQPHHVAATKMGFRVYADGKLVADTGLLRPVEGCRTIDVDVSGTSKIVLESVDGGYWLGTPQLMALWRDVRFEGDAGLRVEQDLSGAETPQFGILTPEDEETPRFNGAWTYGVRPGNPILHRVAVTGNEPLEVSVVGVLPKGLVFDPSRRLLTGSLEERGDHRIEFLARNAWGEAKRTLTVRVGDKLCLTPPMGWSAWNAWRCGISDKIIRETADVFIEKRLADHGWTYINLDDGWQRGAIGATPPAESSVGDPKRTGNPRNDDGSIRPNGYFPDMKALADYLHSFGLKFGIYSSPGRKTCARYVGSYGHEAQDVETWTSWGVDYVKYDWCFYSEIFNEETAGRTPTDDDRIKPFKKLYKELLRQPRDFVYSFSGYGGGAKTGEANGANLWRTWFDLKDGWGCVLNAARSTMRQRQNSHPGFWPDPDMLVVGRLHTGVLGEHDTLLTPNEQYAHVSLWAILNAPLVLGCRMNVLDEFTTKLLVNPEVIDVDQDVAEGPGGVVVDTDEALVLAKTLSDGSKAICAVNLRPFIHRVAIDFGAVGLTGEVRVRDLWRRKDLDSCTGMMVANLPPHAPLFVRCFAVKQKQEEGKAK